MSTSTYKNNFNLLRFLFASLVIVSHAPELQDGNRGNEILTQIFGTISFGEMAVDSFFLLSGFLIVKSWVERPSALKFLSNRILRIYPGFVVASLICALIVGPLFGALDYFQNFMWHQFAYGLVKLRLLGTPPVFAGSPHAALNGAMWTIPLEFQCYLLVLFGGLIGVFKRRWVWGAVFIACTALHILNRIGVGLVPFDLSIRLLMAFSAGGSFYLYRDNIPWTRNWACTSLLLCMMLLFIKPFAEPAVSVFWGYAILYYAMAGKAFLGFNRLPDISYGVYLYAWPINKVLLWQFPTINIYLAIFVIFVFAVFFGTLSWYLVEKPFMKLKVFFA